MATISQNEVRLLIKNSLTVMRDRVEVGLLSTTMLKHELNVCARRIVELAEMLGNDDNIKIMASVFTIDGTCVLTAAENVQAVDELFTQKGV